MLYYGFNLLVNAEDGEEATGWRPVERVMGSRSQRLRSVICSLRDIPKKTFNNSSSCNMYTCPTTFSFFGARNPVHQHGANQLHGSKGKEDINIIPGLLSVYGASIQWQLEVLAFEEANHMKVLVTYIVKSKTQIITKVQNLGRS